MKTRLARRMAALLTTALLAGSLLVVVAAPAVLAASDAGCTALGGEDSSLPGTCKVSAGVTVTGTVNVGEHLHLLAGAVLTVNPSPFTLNVTGNLEMDNTAFIDGSSSTGTGDSITVNVGGNMTMHGGSTISSASTDFGGTAGTITIHVGNYPNIPPLGIFVMEPGSKISANGGGSGTANDIVITAGRSAEIDGQVLSQVLSGLTGTGAVQGRDGAAIFIDTGCGLDVSPTGVISSRGGDPGADLVHLSSCEVTIQGLVESTGPGHAIPNNPPNHCDNTYRPGKPSNSTGCVEVWADHITITDTGQINADVNSTGAGGATGQSWIDLFARTDINIAGRTSGAFAVHANGASGSDGTPNTITAKVVNGTFTGSNRLFSASNQGNGSAGGDIVVEASGAVTFTTGTVMAAGDNVGGGIGSPPPCDGGSGACGAGGTINVRSFNAGISWVNGVGDVNPDRQPSANAGTIGLTACTTVTTTGTNFDDATPTVVTGACGGNPVLPTQAAGQYDVLFRTTIWAACGQATVSGVKWNDRNGNGVRDLPGDVGLPNWHIHVVGPAPDPTDRDLTTATDGSWTVNVPAGTYTICETLQSAWAQTYPASGTACPGSTFGYTRTVTTGCCVADNTVSTGNDFGNFQLPRKSGLKFNDLNGNGQKDPGEPGLDGWDIQLRQGATVIQTATTANGGVYEFVIAASGVYQICEVPQPPSWSQTYPNASFPNPVPNTPNESVGTVCPNGAYGYQVTVQGGDVLTDNDFGNFQQAHKSGKKFNDLNNSKDFSAGEPGIAGWPINLYKLPDGVNAVQTTNTAGDGSYSFTISAAGSYRVCEGVGAAGFSQTFPNASTLHPGETLVGTCPGPNVWGYEFTVTSGSNFSADDFGNVQPTEGPPTCPEDPNRAPLLTRTVNLSKPNLSGGGVAGNPKNYWTVQAAYDAAKVASQSEVIGLFANTTENLVLNGTKSLTITQCTVARVTAANNSLPVWNITSTGKLTIVGPDSVGGTIGWSVGGNGGHTLKSIRANGASLDGVLITSNTNSVSWNDVSGNGNGTASAAGIRVQGGSNTLKGGTVGSNNGDGVQLVGNSNNLSGATIQSNSANGVLVSGSSNTVTSNSRINLNGKNGILISGSTNTISSNASESGKGNVCNGIQVSAGSGNQLTDNKMASNGQAGFNLAAGTGTKVKSNANSNNTGNEFTIGSGNVDQGSNKKNGTGFTFTSSGGTFN